MPPATAAAAGHSVTWDPSETFSRGRTSSPKGQRADPTWRAGFARLAPLNLTFEAWLYHPQLLDLAGLARAFPRTTIILNHVGGPLGIGAHASKKDETLTQGKAGIAELGKCPNVGVKLGGLGMLFGMFDFHTRETPPSSEELAQAYKPYVETCIAAFGQDRSNFLPDGVSSSYAVVWNAFKRLAANSLPRTRRRRSAEPQSGCTVSAKLPDELLGWPEVGAVWKLCARSGFQGSDYSTV